MTTNEWMLQRLRRLPSCLGWTAMTWWSVSSPPRSRSAPSGSPRVRTKTRYAPDIYLATVCRITARRISLTMIHSYEWCTRLDKYEWLTIPKVKGAVVNSHSCYQGLNKDLFSGCVFQYNCLKQMEYCFTSKLLFIIFIWQRSTKLMRDGDPGVEYPTFLAAISYSFLCSEFITIVIIIRIITMNLAMLFTH